MMDALRAAIPRQNQALRRASPRRFSVAVDGLRTVAVGVVCCRKVQAGRCGATAPAAVGPAFVRRHEGRGRPPTRQADPEILERVAGIEPALQAWEAGALPLHHTRTPCRLARRHGTDKGVPRRRARFDPGSRAVTRPPRPPVRPTAGRRGAATVPRPAGRPVPATARHSAADRRRCDSGRTDPRR